MSFQEKNITVTLISFILILFFVLNRVFGMVQGEAFTAANVFGMWGTVIFMAIVVTVVAIILTHAIPLIIQARKSGDEELEIDDIQDERDLLIDLRGTRITYSLYSLGVFIAMLTFVFGQSPLVMFTLIIVFGVVAQIVGDILRLVLYRRGF